jgi:predicted Zn-dependent protease
LKLFFQSIEAYLAMKRYCALVLAIALPFTGLAGCSVNPATGEQSFTGFMSPKDEARIGAEEHPKALRQFGGVYKERDLDAYVRRVGESLAAVSDRPDIRFTITLLNSDVVNAFALPGGYVYVTRGILALAENEAEIAGVLAHEIGHIVARHSAQRYSGAVATNLGLAILGIGAQVVGAPPGIGELSGTLAQGYLMKFSREQELESDMLGVCYLVRAGYDPNAMTSFFRKLKAHSALQAKISGRKDADNFDIMATHPRTTDRIAQAINLARTAPVSRPRVARKTYLNHIDGMLFGDDPKQGVIKGRTFVHPDLRFSFTVPNGFVLQNGASQVGAKGPLGALIVFDIARNAMASDTKTLNNYLAYTWGKGLRLINVERITINGLEAVTAEARVNASGGARDLRLIAIRGEGDRIYRLRFLTPPQLTGKLAADLQRTTNSFRRLSVAQAAAVKPLRVRIVNVGSARQIAGLVKRMPFDKYDRQWFETLNGLAAGQIPLAGNLAKVVSE